MFKIGLLLVGIVLTLGGSNNINKELTADQLINNGPGTYKVYGLFSSHKESGLTYIQSNKHTLTAWGCEYCDGYGKAIVEKRGSNVTIKEFEPLKELATVAKVISIEDDLDKAVIEVNGNKIRTPVKVEGASSNAYLIDNNWVIR